MNCFAVLFQLKLRLTFTIVALLGLTISSTVLAAGESCLQSLKNTSPNQVRASVVRLEDRELSMMAWNVNNLFERRGEFLGDKKGSKNKEIKPEHEIKRVRDEIALHMPDFGVFTEVENVAAMRRLLEEDPRLKGQYHVFLKNGNDARGIDICLVVKKDLGLKFKFDTYKSLQLKDQGEEGPLFSRDLPVLRIYQEGDLVPSLIIMGNHAKSQRDREGDPNSSRWRSAQYKAIAEISDKYESQYPGVPQILAGDFNINVNLSAEINPIRKKFESVYNLVPEDQQIPVSERITHWFFPFNGDPVKQQLDDIRVRGYLKILQALIRPLKDRQDQELEEGPQSFKEREKLASDHAPLVMKFRTAKKEN
ncbi:MAG: endonuclease/exonuclease/phosphatase family protein [Bdellovibrionales bacterium]